LKKPVPSAKEPGDGDAKREISPGAILGAAFRAKLQRLAGGSRAPFQRGARPSFVAPLTAVVSFLVLVLLFALIFKVLPDVVIGWKDV
jgi:uncharacterized BrkB/YihY/UPF0761 family membrane protein